MTEPATPDDDEWVAIQAVIDAARAYARHSHGNIGNPARYRAREEARDVLLDALAHLDRASVRFLIAIHRDTPFG